MGDGAGAGHMLPVTHPDKLVEAVEGAVADLSPPGATIGVRF